MSAPNADQTPEHTSIGLDPHLAGLLAYLFGWVSGLILLLVEKEHREVRYHAAQSLVLSLALTVLYVAFMVISFIPVLGLIFLLVEIVVGIAAFALWIYLLIQGYQLNHVKLPVAGDLAEQWSAKVGLA